jgi:Dolichyl-phosphate-mannose-protein mannosyltransferase
VNYKAPAHPTASIKAALLFVVAFGLYFGLRSPVLDDHDSVQFAMGVLDFNLWMGQPHAPGYPLFIFLGWIARTVFGIGPNVSLHFVSAAGGALFVATWFLIVREEFSERLAWWVAISLAILPAVWMTSTKVLTDTLAAGLMSAELLVAIHFLKNRRMSSAIAAALLGAAACGARPQSILVVLVILGTALYRGRAGARISSVALIVLVAGCLVWLIPVSYLQWRLNPRIPLWEAYPKLCYHQWQWRLNKPTIYIGAGNWSARYLGTHFLLLLLGWFGLGFGFIKSILIAVIGTVIAIAGLVAYWAHRRQLHDGKFWAFHAPWSLTHVAIMFISLAPMPRYYLIVFPLFLIALLRGFLQSRSAWKWMRLALPALLLYIIIPSAIENHRNPPPALRLVRYLGKLYPGEKRKEVALVFENVTRHAQWYTPGFVIFLQVPPPQKLPQVLSGAAAAYTDDARLPLPSGWRLIPIALFKRPALIFWKHHSLELYLIDRHKTGGDSH